MAVCLPGLAIDRDLVLQLFDVLTLEVSQHMCANFTGDAEGFWVAGRGQPFGRGAGEENRERVGSARRAGRQGHPGRPAHLAMGTARDGASAPVPRDPGGSSRPGAPDLAL